MQIFRKILCPRSTYVFPAVFYVVLTPDVCTITSRVNLVVPTTAVLNEEILKSVCSRLGFDLFQVNKATVKHSSNTLCGSTSQFCLSNALPALLEQVELVLFGIGIEFAGAAGTTPQICEGGSNGVGGTCMLAILRSAMVLSSPLVCGFLMLYVDEFSMEFILCC